MRLDKLTNEGYKLLLRIPIRGYERPEKGELLDWFKVTNPYKGL